MTPNDAQKKLRKILGSRFAWRDNGSKTSPEQREAAHEAWQVAAARCNSAKQAMEQRRAELLMDPEYRRLVDQYKAENAARDKSRTGGGYRITVGIDSGLFFEVKAQGDNWADVVRKFMEKS